MCREVQPVQAKNENPDPPPVVEVVEPAEVQVKGHDDALLANGLFDYLLVREAPGASRAHAANGVAGFLERPDESLGKVLVDEELQIDTPSGVDNLSPENPRGVLDGRTDVVVREPGVFTEDVLPRVARCE